MNLLPTSSHPEDLLNRAESLLRQTPVPPGPSAEMMGSTLAALSTAAATPLSTPFPRRHSRRRLLKAAAVLLLAGGGLFSARGILRFATPLAFAEVAQKLHNVRSLAYQMTTQAPNQKEPATVQIFVKDPGWVRMETAGGQVGITRREQDKLKTLTLDPNTKMAILLEANGASRQHDPQQLDGVQLVEQLRELVDKEGQPAGTEQIGRVRAQGFRVRQGQHEWLVWADPQTSLPLRIDIAMPNDIRVTLSEFRINPPLDDALFRLDVPKGYKLQPLTVDVPTPENALVWLLRTYAETSGGRFPKRLDDPAAFGKHLRQMRGGKAREPFDPEDMQYLMNSTCAVVFVTTLKQGYGYNPGTAKLGDAEAVIFWYRPTGTAKYRALYGDLHWAEVTTDRLPEVPKP